MNVISWRHRFKQNTFIGYEGYLPTQPELTLFIIFQEGELFGLKGAFIPDADESRGYDTAQECRDMANSYLVDWVTKNAHLPQWIAEHGNATMKGGKASS